MYWPSLRGHYLVVNKGIFHWDAEDFFNIWMSTEWALPSTVYQILLDIGWKWNKGTILDMIYSSTGTTATSTFFYIILEALWASSSLKILNIARLDWTIDRKVDKGQTAGSRSFTLVVYMPQEGLLQLRPCQSSPSEIRV